MRYICQSAVGIVATCLLLLSAVPSYAQNETAEAAKRVPAGINSVVSGGFWTQGTDEGFFRVIVTAGGVEHVAHKLYIQWLKTDAKTQGYALVRTTGVKELNGTNGAVFKVKTSFGDINAYKIDVTANSRGGKIRRYAITVKGDGRYVLTSH
jgi:hypothetical protein